MRSSPAEEDMIIAAEKLGAVQEELLQAQRSFIEAMRNHRRMSGLK